jgi:cobalt-zinc-cadmium efflux system protein
MVLLLKGHPDSYRPTVMRACCDFSHLIDTHVTVNGHKAQLLWMAVGLLSSLFVAELVTGLLSHSLSLLAEAGHLLSDIAALGISLVATRLAQRPTAKQATFGNRRLEILAALVNGLALLAIAAILAKEAIGRLQSPESILGLPVLIVAGVGLAVNIINIALLHKASRNDLNMRGAFLHVVADTISSVGIILAALLVYLFNWMWVDAVIGLMIACTVSFTALPLVRDSLEVLMEYAPRSVNPVEVEAALKSFAAVCQIEKLHIWTIGSGQVALCTHLTVDVIGGGERDRLVNQLQNHLKQEFGICESTLQLTHRNSTEIIELHPLLRSNLIEKLTQMDGSFNGNS